ncbi:MAG: hypothetical protein P4L35_15180 [Ignavibacteriaceae bacterium]|nr:hypothetical protein [Ignavibacteriaceae bacterium]
MNEFNLYWPVYKNLEKEFLQLADYIHFSDDQTNVYSMHIADLIVRCSIEIEAISKELYLNLGGNLSPVDAIGNKRDLYFDTDCIDLLEKQWKLGNKQIIVSAATFYFSADTNKILTPLHKANKRGSSGSKWKQAYQSVKHSRKSSLKIASIENLLHAMGALYILNLYYKDVNFNIGRVYMGTNEFDNRVGSEVFSVFTYKATLLSMSSCMDDSCIMKQKDNDLDSSIYIIKYDNESFIKMHESYCKNSEITIINFNNSPEVDKFLKENPDYKIESINKTCMDAGGMDLLRRILSFNHENSKDTKAEAMINKHVGIYPTVENY